MFQSQWLFFPGTLIFHQNTPKWELWTCYVRFELIGNLAYPAPCQMQAKSIFLSPISLQNPKPCSRQNQWISSVLSVCALPDSNAVLLEDADIFSCICSLTCEMVFAHQASNWVGRICSLSWQVQLLHFITPSHFNLARHRTLISLARSYLLAMDKCPYSLY